jgi:hypothetical protein
MLKLGSMACLRGMVVAPQPGAFFPRLKSLRLLMDEVREIEMSRHAHGRVLCMGRPAWPA